MKVKLTLEDVEVPEQLLPILLKYAEHLEDCPKNCSECDDLDSCVGDFVYGNRYDEFPDGIYSEEIAYLVAWYIYNDVPYEGGYNYLDEISVGEFTVIAVGWNNGVEDSNPRLIAYGSKANQNDNS